MSHRTATRTVWVSILGMLQIRRYRYGLYLVALLCANNIVELMPVGSTSQQAPSVLGVAALGAVLVDIVAELAIRLVVMPLWRSLMSRMGDTGGEG